MSKAEWGGNPICWWLGLYFCFVCCLDEASCTGCCWWLGDAGSCIPVVSFAWVLTIWYPLGLALWYFRVLVSVLPLQSLRAWSQVLCGSVYSFLLVRYSCLLSAGILHALLCLRVYSWWREMYSTSTYSSAILFSPWIKQFFSQRIEKTFVGRFSSSKFFQVELIEKVFSSYKPWTPLHGRALLAWASS